MSFESGSEHRISSQSVTFYEVDHWTESHEKKTTRTQNFWDGIKNQCELEDHPIPKIVFCLRLSKISNLVLDDSFFESFNFLCKDNS